MLGKGAPSPVDLDNMGLGDGGGSGNCCFPGCVISMLLLPVFLISGFIRKAITDYTDMNNK